METDLRVLIVVALSGLLIILRLDAARFGAAEYDDDQAGGGWRAALRRLAWYAVGLVIAAGIFAAHPSPVTTLGLAIGSDRVAAVGLGLAFGLVGAAVAGAYAWLRYGRLRLPSARTYPGALANSLGTALIDEVAFRGALMGLLLTAGLPVVAAVLIQDLVYGLATRLGAPGRSRGMLILSLVLGGRGRRDGRRHRRHRRGRHRSRHLAVRHLRVHGPCWPGQTVRGGARGGGRRTACPRRAGRSWTRPRPPRSRADERRATARRPLRPLPVLRQPLPVLRLRGLQRQLRTRPAQPGGGADRRPPGRGAAAGRRARCRPRPAGPDPATAGQRLPRRRHPVARADPPAWPSCSRWSSAGSA